MLSKNDRYRHETFQDVFRETFAHTTKCGLFGLGCALLFPIAIPTFIITYINKRPEKNNIVQL